MGVLSEGKVLGGRGDGWSITGAVEAVILGTYIYLWLWGLLYRLVLAWEASVNLRLLSGAWADKMDAKAQYHGLA